MTAQPHETGPNLRPEPTIRRVRTNLPDDQRDLFNAAIDRTPLHEIAGVLAEWDLRARALTSPAVLEAVHQYGQELAGDRDPEPLLTEDQIREQHPVLRP